jgi:hypothetical protein
MTTLLLAGLIDTQGWTLANRTTPSGSTSCPWDRPSRYRMNYQGCA